MRLDCLAVRFCWRTAIENKSRPLAALGVRCMARIHFTLEREACVGLIGGDIPCLANLAKRGFIYLVELSVLCTIE